LPSSIKIFKFHWILQKYATFRGNPSAMHVKREVTLHQFIIENCFQRLYCNTRYTGALLSTRFSCTALLNDCNKVANDGSGLLASPTRCGCAPCVLVAATGSVSQPPSLVTGTVVARQCTVDDWADIALMVEPEAAEPEPASSPHSAVELNDALRTGP
jgi:hypothetical protein